MNRRGFLRAGGIAATTAIAGCTGLFETRTISEPPVVEDRPAAVYYPTHVEGMEMIGMGRDDGRAVGLMYSYPHRFWTVTGTRTERVDVEDDDSIHLMASLWEPETNTVLPVETGLTFEVRQGGETVTERAPWPMLSQNMGFHFGDNVALPGDGTYTVVVETGSMNLDRHGAFDGRFETPGTVEFEFEYVQADRDEIMYRELDDQQGEPGAVPPMEMDMVPLSTAPATGELPGQVIEEAESGDATFVVTADEVGGDPYLAVSPRTPHNGYVLPMMSVSATVERDGTAVFDGSLRKAIDPDRDYHYGATVDGIESGDELTITVEAPPLTSRHEGYETAFIEMEAMTVSVS